VLLVARFDRERGSNPDDDFVRHSVLSAATVLRADDGGQDRSRWSYLELAD
jgi:hypothetical protein